MQHFFNFYVSHDSATKFLRNGEKYYIYFIDNLLLFPIVEELSKSVLTADDVIAKSLTPLFSETQCIYRDRLSMSSYTGVIYFKKCSFLPTLYNVLRQGVCCCRSTRRE